VGKSWLVDGKGSPSSSMSSAHAYGRTCFRLPKPLQHQHLVCLVGTVSLYESVVWVPHGILSLYVFQIKTIAS